MSEFLKKMILNTLVGSTIFYFKVISKKFIITFLRIIVKKPYAAFVKSFKTMF